MNAPLLKPRPKRNIFFAMRVNREEKAEIEPWECQCQYVISTDTFLMLR